jgi:zinc protease
VRGRELANQVSTSYQSTSRLDSLFSVEASPRDGHSLAELEAAVLAELDALKAAPPAPAELERVKSQVLADTVFQQDSMFFQAMLIGTLESAGLPWRTKDDYDQAIQAVTPAQVQAVARRFLVRDRMTVASLLPSAAAEGR